MNVTETTKNAYRNDSGLKEVRLYFPDLDLTISTGQIDSESMELVESLSEDESIEFVGCIASQFKITVHNISENIKGEEIEAYITCEDTEEIPIFHGVVDSVSISGDKSHKSLTCYDELDTKGNIDVAEWYKGLTFPISLKDLRDSLFSYLGMTQVLVALPNDSIEVEKQYSPNTMRALDVIKSICQINGVFGIINRENKFDYRTLPKSESATVTEEIQYYKALEYQEYTVNPVDKLTIRQTEQDEGVSYGDGENNYIIQGNMFTLNLEEETLEEIAENIYPNVEGFYYVPFESDNNGFPWIECGKDIVSYTSYDYDNSTESNPVYKTMVFYILKRTLFGLQNLRDSYEAEGDEYQRVFITDLQSRVETIVEQVSSIVGQLEDFSLNYVVFTNENKLIIHDGDEVSVWRVNFAVQKPTQVMVKLEYLLECETTVENGVYNDLNLTVKYYFDDIFIDTRQPKQTLVDGDHILSLYYILNVDNANIQHKFEVRLVADGGEATIDIGQALNTMVGQKLIGQVWDGTLEVRQIVPRTNIISPIPMITNDISDSISCETQIPISDSISQSIRRLIMTKPEQIIVNDIAETMSTEVE